MLKRMKNIFQTLPYSTEIQIHTPFTVRHIICHAYFPYRLAKWFQSSHKWLIHNRCAACLLTQWQTAFPPSLAHTEARCNICIVYKPCVLQVFPIADNQQLCLYMRNNAPNLLCSILWIASLFAEGVHIHIAYSTFYPHSQSHEGFVWIRHAFIHRMSSVFSFHI